MSKNTLRCLASAALLSFLWSCSAAPSLPTFSKRGSGDGTPDDQNAPGPAGSEGPTQKELEEELLLKKNQEFEAFVTAVDGAKANEMSPSAPLAAALVGSQITLNSLIAESGLPIKTAAKATGACLIFATGTTVLEAKDFAAGGVKISSSGKLAYSESRTLESAGCQKYFQEALGTKYTSDFYRLHVAFYPD